VAKCKEYTGSARNGLSKEYFIGESEVARRPKNTKLIQE